MALATGLVAIGLLTKLTALFLVPALLTVWDGRRARRLGVTWSWYLTTRLAVALALALLFAPARHWLPPLARVVESGIARLPAGTRGLVDALAAGVHRLLGGSLPLQVLYRLDNSPPRLTFLRRYFAVLFAGFWGNFGHMEAPLPVPLYGALAVVSGVAIAGLGRLARDIGRGRGLAPWQAETLLVFLVMVSWSSVVMFFRDGLVQSFSQGRHLFPIIVPMAVLFVVGLRWSVPRFDDRQFVRALVVGLALVDVLGLVLTLLPHFYGVALFGGCYEVRDRRRTGRARRTARGADRDGESRTAGRAAAGSCDAAHGADGAVRRGGGARAYAHRPGRHECEPARPAGLLASARVAGRSRAGERRPPAAPAAAGRARVHESPVPGDPRLRGPHLPGLGRARRAVRRNRARRLWGRWSAMTGGVRPGSTSGGLLAYRAWHSTTGWAALSTLGARLADAPLGAAGVAVAALVYGAAFVFFVAVPPRGAWMTPSTVAWLGPAAALLLANGVARLLQLAYVMVVARALGLEAFGELATVTAYPAILGVVSDFGLSRLVVRDVARAPDLGRSYLVQSLQVRTGLAIVVAILFATTITLLGYSPSMQTTAWIGGLSLVTGAAAERRCGLERPRGWAGWRPGPHSPGRSPSPPHGRSSRRGGGCPASSALAFVNLAQASLGGWWIWRDDLAPGPRPDLSIAALGRFLLLGLPFAGFNLLSIVYLRAAPVLLALLRGPEPVGLYMAAFRLVEAFALVPLAVVTALFPTMAVQARAGDGSLRRTYSQAVRLLGLLAFPLAAGTTLLATPLVDLVYGPAYREAGGVWRSSCGGSRCST